ncbi:L-pipecolate oxidase [Aidingimonas halophila]|uniref:Glycine/D-amino acid oxidase n=1 Tax=Aidingimonas halophila TaxID=574349 RepID=A0A1H2WVL2_9GAMM|nr:FAD-binding oxidoreductase [Aidingimonas halophila]GHC27688.1 oxidoreductase [Aidingimonas halophila]SDW84703.1 Glycine/D-amino acid oxidase [Aidingimonas halophila]
MQERCLWYATSPEPPLSLEALEGDHRADVAVIGGGITGLSTALHLAEAGISVSLIEAGDIPNGGSGRNVGLVNAGLWIPPDDIAETLGEVDGERVNATLGAAPTEVFSLIERHRIDCHATRTGTLHLAHNGKGEQELARRAAQFQHRGTPVELLEGESCWRRLGSQRINRALLDHRAGTLNPAAYTRGLARAAHTNGARLYTHSAATGMERAGDGWRVTTDRGSIAASRLVLATNAYTEDQWNHVRHHFFAGHFYQVASEPLSDTQAEDILPDRQGAWDTRMVLSSIRRDADGRLILGSLGKGDSKPASFLRCWADRIQQYYFPQLDTVNWECAWTGRIAFTPDHTLRLFEPAPGILAVTGYNGRGITTGTVVGRGFAHYLMHDDDSLLPLPIRPASPVRAAALWRSAYESGFTLYHAGQCLRLIA